MTTDPIAAWYEEKRIEGNLAWRKLRIARKFKLSQKTIRKLEQQWDLASYMGD